jgi:hypothetical protein
MGSFVLLDPLFIVVPLFGSAFAGVLMPDDYSMGMEQIISPGIGSSGNGNFFSVKIIIRVVRNLLTELPERKCEVGRVKP